MKLRVLKPLPSPGVRSNGWSGVLGESAAAWTDTQHGAAEGKRFRVTTSNSIGEQLPHGKKQNRYVPQSVSNPARTLNRHKEGPTMTITKAILLTALLVGPMIWAQWDDAKYPVYVDQGR